MLSSKSMYVIAVSMLLLTESVACASSAPPAKVLPTPGTAPNAFPTGSFALGQWAFELKNSGVYALKVDGLEENGTYSVTGDQVTLKGERCARLGIENAAYRWTFDGKTLTFKALDDICMNRLSRVDGASWTKNP